MLSNKLYEELHWSQSNTDNEGGNIFISLDFCLTEYELKPELKDSYMRI